MFGRKLAVSAAVVAVATALMSSPSVAFCPYQGNWGASREFSAQYLYGIRSFVDFVGATPSSGRNIVHR